MRGRKPKPTEQRRREGNPGRRPLNADPEIPLVDAVLEVPKILRGRRHKAARDEWQRLGKQLRTARVLTEVDRGALLSLCQQWAKYLDATQKLEDTGLVVKAPSGYPVVNPYNAIANKALGNCIKLWSELGCTPSSRSRVTPERFPSGAGWLRDPLEAALEDLDEAEKVFPRGTPSGEPYALEDEDDDEGHGPH